MSKPLFDDELKLAIAKLICCGVGGCMKMIPMRGGEEDKCWCEMPEFQSSNTRATADKIFELFMAH